MDTTDTIWTGAIAGVVAALATLITQFLTQRHQTSLLNRELEHQTRAALRETYDKLLVTQRRSREASLRLAKRPKSEKPSAGEDALRKEATAAHDEFIDHYHQMNLDASRDMWNEARSLRYVLDNMLEAAYEGDGRRAKRLHGVCRAARQNLERSFRARLGNDDELQEWQPVPKKYYMGDDEKLKEKLKGDDDEKADDDELKADDDELKAET